MSNNWRSPTAAAWLVLLGVVKAAVSVALLSAGFFVITGDDLLRSLIAHDWAMEPFFVASLADYGYAAVTWMPLHLWIVGLAQILVGDLWVGHVAVSLVFGVLAITALFFVGLRCFDLATACLASLMALTLPWHSWMSLSGLADTTYQTAVFGALLLLSVASTASPHRRARLELASAVVLLAANMIRPEAWLFSAGVAAYLAWSMFREGTFELARAAAALLPFLFVGYWFLHNYQVSGDALHFLRGSRQFLVYEAAEADSLLVRMVFFPALLFVVSPLVALCGAAALASAKIRRRVVGPPLLAVYAPAALAFGLLMGSVVAGGLGTNTSPQRFVVIFSMLLCPLAAYALMTVWRRGSVSARGAASVMAGLVIAAHLFGAFRFPRSFDDEVAAGRYLARLARGGDLRPTDRLFTEEEFLLTHEIAPESFLDRQLSLSSMWAVEVASNLPDRFALSLTEECNWDAGRSIRSAQRHWNADTGRIFLARGTAALDRVPSTHGFVGFAGAFGVFSDRDLPAPAEPEVSDAVATVVSEGVELLAAVVDPAFLPRFIDTHWNFDDRSTRVTEFDVSYLGDDGAVVHAERYPAFHPSFLAMNVDRDRGAAGRAPAPFFRRISFPMANEIPPGRYRVQVADDRGQVLFTTEAVWVIPSKRAALRGFVSGANRDPRLLLRVLMAL